MNEMKLRIGHDHSAGDGVELLEAVVKFLGGELQDVTPKNADTWVEYVVRRPPETPAGTF